MIKIKYMWLFGYSEIPFLDFCNRRRKNLKNLTIIILIKLYC